jgi:serine-type D-Ala-D-Ala carboxypeptidase (penicillin-binding protein 5/6)
MSPGHFALAAQRTSRFASPGACRSKTGFTMAAGYCLLFEAHRGTSALIGVVLHSTAPRPGQVHRRERMLNWGFRGRYG